MLDACSRCLCIRLSIAALLPLACASDDASTGGDTTTEATTVDPATTSTASTTGDPLPGTAGTTGTTGDATTSADETTAGTTAADAAAEGTDTGTADGGLVASCGEPEPCGVAQWPCYVPGDTDCDGVEYGPAFECAFAALVASEAGQLHVDFNGWLTGEVDWLDVVVVGDGTAVYQYGMEDSLSFEATFEPAQRCTLQPASWFQDCLSEAVSQAHHTECMDPYAWFADDCVETNMCP